VRRLAPLVSGVVFGLGLALSGMTDPAKIVGFLDVLGDWDPTLAFVMGGALVTHLATSRLVRRRAAPLYAPAFEEPRRGKLDAGLISGSAVFGVGWALAGFCPGPAFVALASLRLQPVAFVAAMLTGMAVFTVTRRTTESGSAAAEEACG
jgi:uncharacterized membrane protein YedE/YeeE